MQSSRLWWWVFLKKPPNWRVSTMKKAIVANSFLLLPCLMAVAQTPDWVPEPSGVRQIAEITVLGDSAVFVERLENGDVVRRMKLGGPEVRIVGSYGEAIAVADLRAPSVVAVPTEKGAAFYGDLELITVAIDPASHLRSDQGRFLVYHALVEIRTERGTISPDQEPAVSPREVPLNQRGEQIRAVLEEVRQTKRRKKN